MRVLLLPVTALLLAGCTSVAGTPTQAPVIGALQHTGPVDVTVLSFVDPAPVYQSSEYDPKPDDGEKLVAAQFRVTNTSDRDYLVDPITEVGFRVSGQDFDNSLVKTSAGATLDQVSLAPGQTATGYVTAQVPTGTTTDTVVYKPLDGTARRWQVADGTVRTPPPPLPARTDASAGAHHPGEPVTIADDDNQLTVAATKFTDPAQPAARVTVGNGEHVVQVDFTASNTGSPITDDPTLRIMTLYDSADEPVRAYVYSMEDSVEHPLNLGDHAQWPVQFVVPDTFAPDHVTFTPEYGTKTTTMWARY